MRRRIANKIMCNCTGMCLAWKHSTLEKIHRKWYPFENSPFGRVPWSEFYKYAKRGGDTVRGRKNYEKQTL